MSTKSISSDFSKKMEGNDSLSAKLPVTHNLKLGYLFSLLIAVMTAVASIAGLLYPKDIYPTDELRQSFLANDVVNLFPAEGARQASGDGIPINRRFAPQKSTDGFAPQKAYVAKAGDGRAAQ